MYLKKKMKCVLLLLAGSKKIQGIPDFEAVVC